MMVQNTARELIRIVNPKESNIRMHNYDGQHAMQMSVHANRNANPRPDACLHFYLLCTIDQVSWKALDQSL